MSKGYEVGDFCLCKSDNKVVVLAGVCGDSMRICIDEEGNKDFLYLTDLIPYKKSLLTSEQTRELYSSYLTSFSKAAFSALGEVTEEEVNQAVDKHRSLVSKRKERYNTRYE